MATIGLDSLGQGGVDLHRLLAGLQQQTQGFAGDQQQQQAAAATAESAEKRQRLAAGGNNDSGQVMGLFDAAGDTAHSSMTGWGGLFAGNFPEAWGGMWDSQLALATAH